MIVAFGGLAQLVEHQAGSLVVAGPSPASSTHKKMNERIRAIIHTFRNSEYISKGSAPDIYYLFEKSEWVKSIIREINQPLARKYIEKINPGFKFSSNGFSFDRIDKYSLDREKQIKAREYIERINPGWKFPSPKR